MGILRVTIRRSYIGVQRKIHGRPNLPLPIAKEKTLIKSSYEAHPSAGGTREEAAVSHPQLSSFFH